MLWLECQALFSHKVSDAISPLGKALVAEIPTTYRLGWGHLPPQTLPQDCPLVSA